MDKGADTIGRPAEFIGREAKGWDGKVEGVGGDNDEANEDGEGVEVDVDEGLEDLCVGGRCVKVEADSVRVETDAGDEVDDVLLGPDGVSDFNINSVWPGLIELSTAESNAGRSMADAEVACLPTNR